MMLRGEFDYLPINKFYARIPANMKKSQKDSPSITYQSPKHELWAAYKKLQQLASNLKKEKATPPEPKRVKLDWHQQLSKTIKKVEAQLQEKEEQTRLLQEKIDSLENLWQKKQKRLEEEFEEEKAWREKKLQKEEEEERFVLEMKRRRLERELEEKEKDWQEREKDYQKLREETVNFPKVLEAEKEKVSKETTVRLEKEFVQEKEMLLQKHQAKRQLLEQIIENLKAKVKEQEQQLKMLNGQLAGAHQKIKELAVAALETRRPKEEKSSVETTS